jgi:hypothetical protein
VSAGQSVNRCASRPRGFRPETADRRRPAATGDSRLRVAGSVRLASTSHSRLRVAGRRPRAGAQESLISMNRITDASW